MQYINTQQYISESYIFEVKVMSTKNLFLPIDQDASCCYVFYKLKVPYIFLQSYIKTPTSCFLNGIEGYPNILEVCELMID
jgi:hypothetical protein